MVDEGVYLWKYDLGSPHWLLLNPKLSSWDPQDIRHFSNPMSIPQTSPRHLCGLHQHGRCLVVVCRLARRCSRLLIAFFIFCYVNVFRHTYHTVIYIYTYHIHIYIWCKKHACLYTLVRSFVGPCLQSLCVCLPDWLLCHGCGDVPWSRGCHFSRFSHHPYGLIASCQVCLWARHSPDSSGWQFQSIFPDQPGYAV